MSSDNLYSEHLYEMARSEELDQDNWMSVLYKEKPLEYVRLEKDEMDILREKPGTESYHDFSVKLGQYRELLPERFEALNSYNIVEPAFEINPEVLQDLAGEDFEREINQSLLETGHAVESVVEGRLEEFKETMKREPLRQEGIVVYGSSLQDLYGRIYELQSDY